MHPYYHHYIIIIITTIDLSKHHPTTHFRARDSQYQASRDQSPLRGDPATSS